MRMTLTEFRSLADAADDQNGAASAELWRKVVSAAERQPELSQEEGVPYILGLAYYELAGSKPHARVESERHLRAALKQDANDSYAKVYLGHLAYDSGAYAEALEWFNAIPTEAFAARNQRWRDLKRQELRICCLAQLGTTESLVSEFEAYLLIASHCEATDVLTVFELPGLLASLAMGRKNVA